MIAEDYVSFEIAKLLKERGFDEPCNNRYYETHCGFDLGSDPGYTNSHWEDWYKDTGVRNYSAPTLQMAMKWLREKHHIFIRVIQSHIEYCTCEIYYNIVRYYDFRESFNSYEEACETAIKYCLKNLI